MELSHPCGAQGVKPTHDFLSLYSSATQQQDHHLTPTIPGHLQTHDYLQPLEQIGKGEEYIKKSKSLPPFPQTIEENIHPGGMGTYSISHISYINQQRQKIPKHEGNVISAAKSSSSNNNDENSNCSSYSGSGFKLWEDSSVNTGKTRKENNIAGSRSTRKEGGIITGVPSQSSYIHNHRSTTFSSLSSSHQSSAPKKQYFVDTVKFGKSVHEEEDFDEEFIKKEPSFGHKGGISVKIDTTSHDQRSNSPRSKHSATEQRRRSKINDRFSMLRGIIPHADQKRDKASFLLEVIEYIQFLQEKVHKYEDSPQLLNNSSTIRTNTQNLLDSSTSQLPQSTNKPFPFAADTETSASQAIHQLSNSKSCTSDGIVANVKLKEEEEVIIESGTISISTIYSQGLSSALTQALKTSGVDLSHAKISVKIDLGTRSNTPTLDSSPPDAKEHKTPTIDQTVTRSRLASTWEEESGEAFKRLKPNRK